MLDDINKVVIFYRERSKGCVMQVRAKGNIAKEYYQTPFASPEKEEGKNKKGKKGQQDNLKENMHKDRYDQTIKDIQMKKYQAQLDQSYIAQIQEIQRQIRELERQKNELKQQYSMENKTCYSKIMADGLIKSYKLGVQTSKAVEAYEKHKTIAC